VIELCSSFLRGRVSDTLIHLCISLVMQGLDPETRQQIWKAIDRVKEGRAIVLTTHSMEEADALTTRIGIMAAGELLCLGSQLRLKNLYGDGLQLKVTLESNADSEVVERFVRGRVCDTVRTLSSPGQRNQVFILVRCVEDQCV
jgi:ABC-type multidrug transport system ATPase subunit